MSETIEQLCRRLPESEGQVRKRWPEFGEELTRALGVTDMFFYPVGHADYADNIKAAKHVTDALRRKCWAYSVQVECDADYAVCKMWTLEKGQIVEVEAAASTEELARSAAALLAAHAMTESPLAPPDVN